MSFVLDFTIGTYLGLLLGLSLAALFVRALRREQRAGAETATTRDRLAESEWHPSLN
jgi:hypothetical protein